ncbi:BEL1-like homeodomain protein 8 [Cajanus cajan]|nr:BEL1-like homeodomain protein 8 [Cajanus cajan]XP_020204745.1 BEL1-like homeodomain protein 8 [Cajanus cajan]XP_020204746.1 BEL1-like homeodomain protein 8 [Cajanus cajan]XP_020204748.1 BEL1-like homeodomain protein 8 [Cajanus cajan]XP_020204749.1 BEL1-like homeodomain protein 8 [Cajanus cajan]XP_029125423.1 BEL1-like homeodomain protein 8 [Cajanus cajan]
MSSLRPELHVAQQLRRDKLRIQNSSQNLQQDFPNNLEQISGFNLDLLQVRNVRNGNMLDDAAALYSSEMITFSTASNPLSAPRNPLECQELMMAQYGSTSFPHSSPKDQQCEPRNLGASWMVNYNEGNHNTFFPSELNNNASGEMANREIQKQLGEMHYPPAATPLYHNALQDMAYGVWGGNNGEPVINPSYGTQGNNELRFGGANLWTNSPFGFKKISEQEPNPQTLSLSLSSNSNHNSKPCFEEGSASDDPQYSKPEKSTMKLNVLANNTVYRNVGPLGPFTGYATILKSSRFLKPCQQLLDEWCCQSGSKFVKGGVCNVPEWVSRDVSAASTSAAADALNVEESVAAAEGGSNSGASLYSSNENTNSADGGAASSFCLSSRPECQKNKAKLLYMQDEVTRRYKQYHQQMQMVVQSFESVAGLSSATPYVSLALKSVSKHFRCLKNAISDQLKLTCEVLGDEFSIPTTSTSCKLDNNMARLRCMDQSFQKNKSGGANINFLEPQQHVWRPQRGLPERSVAILKAWLFEHFLHPYPTDTDKHMLATQTGLSRNQVSNWFINARVRVWKPMVEEIHMLETKGATEAHQASSKNDQGASASEGSNHHQPVSRFSTHASSHAIPEKQFHCLEMGSSSSAGNEEHIGMDEDQWNQEKRSKLECQLSTAPNIDGTMMGFMPYRRGGLEVGGLGSVSLTLGLRHGVEGVQQQQQLQHEEELRRQFGGHMIHDFVG